MRIIITIALFIVLIICLMYQNITTESFSPNKNAVCLLCRNIPDPIWLNLLNDSDKDAYDYYVVMDTDVSGEIPTLKTKYPNIEFIWIPDDECKKYNYTNSDYVFKPIVATDRAYYYFARKNTIHNHIWFIEDDVWFRKIDDLTKIDTENSLADLIVPNSTDYVSGDKWEHWGQIEGRMDSPWSHWIICACRISRSLLNKMDELTQTQGRLIYKEIMFHTLAKQHNMQIAIPEQLQYITWNDNVSNMEHKDGHLYHPIKNMNMHETLRSR